ncbi:hypothetical protein Esti_002074 [Eimeria stiedai]
MTRQAAKLSTGDEIDRVLPSKELLDLGSLNGRHSDGSEPVHVQTVSIMFAPSYMESDPIFTEFSRKQSCTGCKLKTINFLNPITAAQAINSFVEEQTDGHFKNMVDASALSESTQMILANALLFKAPWHVPFNSETVEGTFRGITSTGEQAQVVQYLKRIFTNDQFWFELELGLRVVCLQYADPRLRFCFFLPDNFEEFESSISLEPGFLERKLSLVSEVSPRRNRQLALELPKFSLSAKNHRLDLAKVLKRLGVRSIFSEGSADLSEMTSNRQEFFVSAGVHQADFAVTPGGTEGTDYREVSEPAAFRPIHVKVNTPFLFTVAFVDGIKPPKFLLIGRVVNMEGAHSVHNSCVFGGPGTLSSELLIQSHKWVSSVVTMSLDVGSLTATRLHSALCREASKPNFVISPYSILGVFHMAQCGADGATKKEMDTLLAPETDFKLSFRKTVEDRVVVEAANRLYASKRLAGNACFQAFSKELGLATGAEARTVDFAQPEAAAREINDFVKEKTRDHISNLVDASMMSEATRLLLVNALYFKAPWSSQFKHERTFKRVFNARTLQGVEAQRVSFMHHELESGFSYVKTNEVTAFFMSYADDRLRMFVYMPEDLNSFESKVAATPNHLQELAALLLETGCGNRVLKLDFPKFKLAACDNSVDLTPIFRDLGAPRMFDRQLADFQKISGSRDVWVSGYVHQADIDVNEEGTEATAATAMLMCTLALGEPKEGIILSVDKPFLFEVRFDDAGRTPFILFSGRISDVASAQ